VHTERHAERFRARDVLRRDVIDVTKRPAQPVETLGLVDRFQVSSRSLTAELLITCWWTCQPPRAAAVASLPYSFMMSAGQ
jgi:hypothetical protein